MFTAARISCSLGARGNNVFLRNTIALRTSFRPTGCTIQALSFSTFKIPSSSIGSVISSKKNSSFNIAHVSHDGTVKQEKLRAEEVLKGSCLQARDLFSLALTNRGQNQNQERRERRSQLGRKSSSHIQHRRPMCAILPRGNQIIVSFGSIRGVVGTDSAMLFDAQLLPVVDFAQDVASICAEQKLSAAKKFYLVAEDKQEEEPFEIFFLEEVLKTTCDAYSRRVHLFEPIVDSMLNRVSNEVFSDSGVHRLVPVKNSLQSFEIRVQQSLDCLTELLGNDDDMLGLLLTEQKLAKAKNQTVSHERHKGVELLLEDYARQLNNILLEIKHLLQQLQSKQEFVALALDGYRNRVIRMNTYISMFGLGTACGTAVAGFFGMNVITGYEESTAAFGNIVIGSGMAGVAIIVGCSSYISGKSMKERAEERLDQIETLTGALSDMNALDYTVKQISRDGTPMNRSQFKETLRKARHSKSVSEAEAELLFNALDTSEDGLLYNEDFQSPYD
mmetsp:Transcript_8774/g.13457  ORF Transcript_8774/g.13457 Transcript_8774/m.13457 type:complete len:504 (-) Transcript_8774:165-1676(-)|eukprot:CAMPEP_0195304984 /NCGR_PEP_ID=MMETSP0707-20130614/35469_1 /TAXON_ID=33640 /ORGANISM="Asterionellopsis glacialis, Strain CCMP134" /LENGTH=503 /DNA_ID=CAMNT_0040368971 /DNA_START=209 /DNA_END=1720 /DNA_ORIENTATION=+